MTSSYVVERTERTTNVLEQLSYLQKVYVLYMQNKNVESKKSNGDTIQFLRFNIFIIPYPDLIKALCYRSQTAAFHVLQRTYCKAFTTMSAHNDFYLLSNRCGIIEKQKRNRVRFSYWNLTLFELKNYFFFC